MKQPLVSIIIPTYNRLLSLAELMESLSRQTFQRFEVIIVNDAGESVRPVKQHYPDLNIKIVDLERNSGHVHARNQGLLRAEGELVMLIDDDDLIVPTHLETMVNEIDGCDLVYSDVEIVNFTMKDGVRIPNDRYLFAYELDLPAMRRFSTYVSSGSLYRRNLHEMIGNFDEGVHNYWDWDFFLRVSDRYRVKRVPAAGVLYEFSSAGNNQSKDLSESRRYYLNLLSEKHQLGRLPTKNFFLLLEEPEVKERRAQSKVLWDGNPFVSRLITD